MTTSKPRIYADFNKLDRPGRAVLTCAGTLKDIASLGIELLDGLEVLLYGDDFGEDGLPDDLEVDAVVRWNTEKECWVGCFDPDGFRHASDAIQFSIKAPRLGGGERKGVQSKKDRVVEVPVSSSKTESLSPILMLRSSIAGAFLVGADEAARNCGLMEKCYRTPVVFNNQIHRARVMTSIIASAAFLEASINELYADCVQGISKEGPVAGMTSDQRKAVSSVWNKKHQRRTSGSVLSRYQDLVEAIGKEKMEENESSPLFMAKLVLDLRNALLHYFPEFANHEEIAHRERALVEGLKGLFQEHPLYEGQGNPDFPAKLLSYGCARWGVISTIDFYHAFHDHIGLGQGRQDFDIENLSPLPENPDDLGTPGVGEPDQETDPLS